MKLKNREIEPLLMSIMFFKDGNPDGGLLTEKITLGLRRRLQKIRQALILQYEVFKKDLEDAQVAGKQEIEILMDEEFEIQCEPVSMQMIEEIESTTNYDMSIIEKIAV